ncbi:MAG: hypothetical protein CMN76_11250 [Spirochaetaceae bacterium]|nr:hypothetical protein [Spirochaetaceae bacterium]
MKRFLERYLLPQSFESAADERRTRVLLSASLWLIVICFVFLYPLGLFGILGQRFLLLGTISLFSAFLFLALLKLGRSRLAGYLLLALFLLSANLQSLEGRGIYDTIFMLNLLAVMIAGTLFGRWSVLITALLAAALSLGVAAFTSADGSANFSDPGPYTEWFRRTAYILIAVVLYWLGWKATNLTLRESDKTRSQNRALMRSLSNIMEQGNIGHWYWNIQTGKVIWSSNVAGIFGVKASDFQGSFDSFLKLVFQEDRQKLQDALESAMKSPGSSYQVEHRIRTNEGEVRWLEGRGNVRFEEGQAIDMAGVVMDITDQKRAQSALDQVYSILAEGIVIHNTEGTIVSFNRSALEILELSADQLQGKKSTDPHWDIIDEEGNSLTASGHPSSVAMATGRPQYSRILGVRRKDGSVRWLTVSAIPFSPDGSERRGAAVSFFDITAERNQASALQKSEEQLRFILENQPGIVVILDMSGRLVYINNAAAGFDPAEVKGKHATEFVVEEDRAKVEWALDRIRREKEPFSYDVRGFNGDGGIAWYSSRIGLLEYQDQERIIIIASDVSDRVAAEQKLRSMAYTDLLTGLPNREALYTHLSEILVSDTTTLRAILFVDLDHFKNINDTLGHDVGDRLLKQVSLGFAEQLTDRAFFARLGGDEFMMVYTVADEAEAQNHADRILAMFKNPINVDGHELYLSASIGICFFPGDGEDMHQLIKNADAAMYRAKARGRNNYCRFEPSMEKEIQTRLLMDTELRRAAGANELELHYQPVFDLSTDSIVGLEALMRWNSETLGSVSPGQFIPLAEETGFIRELDLWTLRTGIAQLASWRKQGVFHGRLALNLSARQLENNRFIPELSALLRESSLTGRDISLELTETALMKNITAMAPLLKIMGEMGIELMIDDFGTGYSSLNYLKRLPVDVVKIDRSFVEEIGNDESDSIVRTIIAMARTLDLKVVAEGVETNQQLEFLKREGCDLAQGFYLAMPAPESELLSRLKQAAGANPD